MIEKGKKGRTVDMGEKEVKMEKKEQKWDHNNSSFRNDNRNACKATEHCIVNMHIHIHIYMHTHMYTCTYERTYVRTC